MEKLITLVTPYYHSFLRKLDPVVADVIYGNEVG